MGRLRTYLRRLTREIARFPPSAFLECLSHEWKRGRELRSGRKVTRGVHPLLQALKKAKHPQRLIAEGYGTLLMVDAENNRAAVRSEQQE